MSEKNVAVASISFVIVVVLLVFLIAACETDGDKYYHVPGGSHSKTHKPNPKPNVAPKAPTKSFGGTTSSRKR